ncbi:MAG: hypothetical protein WBQ94_12070 [Terracidiphilus sp.]
MNLASEGFPQDSVCLNDLFSSAGGRFRGCITGNPGTTLVNRDWLLFNWRVLPMNLAGELAKMQITVTVSDEIVREAGARGLPVIDFLESLIDKGFSAAKERPVLTSAMERIRALHSASVGVPSNRKR